MKDLTTTAAAVAGTGMLLWPLVAWASHRPGHDKTDKNDKNPSLSIAVEPVPVLWARAVTVRGKLRGSDNGNKRVELEHNPHPFPGPFKRVAATMTDSNGDYSFRIKPAEHTNYRTVARTSPPETSGEVTARVKVRINRRVDDRTPDKGETITFTGKVGPDHDGERVLLQRRKRDGGWKTVRRATLEDAGPDDPHNSVYERKKRVTRDSVFRFRIKAHGDHLGNKTRRIKINVDD